MPVVERLRQLDGKADEGLFEQAPIAAVARDRSPAGERGVDREPPASAKEVEARVDMEPAGSTATADTNGTPNDDAQLWGAFSTNGGASFSTNFQISAGTSNASVAGNGTDYGDYMGLSFYGGVAYPAWADNSNSKGNNPDGALHKFDIYTAAVLLPR